VKRRHANRSRIVCLCATVAFSAIAIGWPALVLSAEPPALPEARVEQPRAFGYVLGDVITQRVLLEREGAPFDLAKLPAAQRVGIWLERRAARTETAADGKRWLIVEYQLVNAPRILTTISVPPLLLDSNQRDVKLLVPEWLVSVSPLTPQTAFDADGLGPLRPDKQATLIATAPIKRQLWIWFVALAATLAAWAAWTQWRNKLAALNQPFARALHEIARLDPASPQAWQSLHRAFDRTAGRVMHVQILPLLFERAPHLQPLRTRIEEFFVASSERFFGSGTPSAAVSLRALCEDLRRIERQYER
jgi:mxaA protein